MENAIMENAIVERIKNAKLTNAQKKIAEYVIHHPEQIGMCSSMEAANRIGVSDASIIRFARAIGYAGFTEMKNDLYACLAKQAGIALSDRLDTSHAMYGESVSQVEFLDVHRQLLERTFRQNDETKFEQAVEILDCANRHYVIGFRGSLGVASQFAWLLRFLVDHVISITDEGPGGIGNLQDADSGDCVLFFSLSRFYKSDLRLMELARQRKTNICLVTDSALSRLAPLADVLFLVEVRHMGFFNSAAASGLIAEYLLTRLAERRQETYHRLAEERDRLTEDLRL